MFSKYKYVYALYQEKSFTRAAEKLFISQPSLSAAIKGIEKRIGAPLFERTGAGIIPTNVGRVYVEAVEQIIRTENDCMRKINDLYNLETGSIRVGGTNYLASYILPRIINRFTSLYPKVEVEVVEAHSSTLTQMLQEEEIDIVIDSFSENLEQFDGVPLIGENVMLSVPADRPINQQLTDYRIHPEDIYRQSIDLHNVPPVSIRLFEQESFITLKKGNDMYARAMDIFRKGEISPKIKFSVDQLNIAFAMSESGIGLCFVTDTLFRYGRASNHLLLYTLAENDGSRTLYVAHKKGRYCTRAMEKFIEISQELIR